MKKILYSLLLFLMLSPLVQAEEIIPHNNNQAGENYPLKHIEVFVREGCSFCAKEEAFLKDLTGIEVSFLDIGEEKNRILYNKVTEKYDISKVTPITIVGNEIVVGFNRARELEIENNILNHRNFYSFEDSLDDSCCINVYGEKKKCDTETYSVNPLAQIKVPFLGEMDMSQYALPTLSITLGFIDGFNPCAMWVLVVFLLALIQLGDKVKMFLAAGIFIFAEAIMYGLILTVWLSAWNFVGMEAWISIVVGIVALGAGCFFLYEGFFTDGTCTVTNTGQKQKISAKIAKLAGKPINLAFIGALILLAFSVNIIEFACSIGIPQTFTLILQNSDISFLERIWYILIYIFFYVVDDLIVFGIALYSIEKIGITHKYSRISNVIGGFLMLLLGGLLLFAPQWLSF